MGRSFNCPMTLTNLVFNICGTDKESVLLHSSSFFCSKTGLIVCLNIVQSSHDFSGIVLVVAQCFCLMPVRGIRSKSAKGLSFRWMSFRTGYCLVYMLLTIADTFLTVNMIRHAELDVRNIGESKMNRCKFFSGGNHNKSSFDWFVSVCFVLSEPLVFHITILFASIGFLRLASKWPRLMRRWEQVERQLPAYQTWQEREDLAKRIRAVTFVLITLSLSKKNWTYCWQGSIIPCKVSYWDNLWSLQSKYD